MLDFNIDPPEDYEKIEQEEDIEPHDEDELWDSLSEADFDEGNYYEPKEAI